MKLKELLKLFDQDEKLIIDTLTTYQKGELITLNITTIDLNTEITYITTIEENFKIFIYIKGE